MKAKKSGQIISGLDIGSKWIRMAAGIRTKEGGLQIIGAAEAPSTGIHKGIVSSIEDAVSSISTCLERLERVIGTPVEHVWVGISGAHIAIQDSKGVVAVAKANREITEEDVARAIEAARTVATPLNYEILHVIPQSFAVDSQTGIKDPVGMTGVRLEVDTKIIQGISSHIKNLTKAVYRTGLDIDDIVLAVLGNAEATLTERQKELGAAVVNIGASTVSVAAFEEGNLLHAAVLPLGSDHITSDIAIGLKTDIDIAEKVKLQFGNAYSKNVNKKDEFNLSELGAYNDETVSKKEVAEIIEARVEEIFSKADKELKKIGKNQRLPGGIILTGGGSDLPGIIETAKEIFKLPASLGTCIEIESITDKVNEPSFTAAIGLAKWGYVSELQHEAKGIGKFVSQFRSVNVAGEKITKWLRSLLP